MTSIELTRLNDRFSAELRRQANRVISDKVDRERHPSYVTKSTGREHLARLNGAVELAFQVLGYLPDDVEERVNLARHEAASWLAR